MNWIKYIKHIIPPSFYVIFASWGFISGLAEIIFELNWINGKYKTIVFALLLILFVVSLFISTIISRFICILKYFKREENLKEENEEREKNLKGLNEQIDIKNDEIRALESSFNIKSQILKIAMFYIQPRKQDEFLNQINLITEVNEIVDRKTENSKNNQ